MADNEKVVGKIGNLPSILVLIDPDGGDRWLVTVGVSAVPEPDPEEADTYTGPEPGTLIAGEPSALVSGMHWMRNNGGYVEDVAPADEAAVNEAVAKFRKAPPTAEDYARADAQWPLRRPTEEPS